MRASIILGVDHQLSKVIALTQGTLRCIPYTPYGYSRPQGGAMVIGFTGQYFDGCLEGYLLGNGYRVYSPWLMRFKSPDRVSPFGRGGINAYAYCEGDPVNWQDHSGNHKSRAVSMFDLSMSGDLSGVFVGVLRTVISYAESFRDSLIYRQRNLEGRAGDAEYFLDLARKDKKPYTAEHLELLQQLSQLVMVGVKIERKKSRVEDGIKKLTGLIDRIEVERFEEPLQDSGMIPIVTGDEYDDSNHLMPDERRRLGTWPSSEMGRLRQ
ncbi:RHS repeat-associated core domain-containing protein [Pseudomonas sp. AA27]|uniref:RHS repeat-associated core domain-containing protein n=1 Tax=Pseudomonas sp. AA27 TaxID=2908652 RepID=UPI003FA360F7